MPPTSREARVDAEWDRLAKALNGYGIRHIAPVGRPRTTEPADPAELFLDLARTSHVRLQEAAILLLLTYPRLASFAQDAIGRLEGAERDRAMRRYMAASALQRMWRSRIRLALGEQPLIPPAYLEELGLPPLEEDYGRATLRALSAQEEARYGYDAWAGYTSLVDLFLAEITLKRWGRSPDSKGRPDRSPDRARPR